MMPNQAEISEHDQQVAIINQSLEVLKTAPEILKTNIEITDKALIIGNTLLEVWEVAWKIEDPTERMNALRIADERSNNFLVKCSTRNKEQKEMRSALTQLMDHFRSMFTDAENKIDVKKADAVPFKVQANRNKYVTELANEQKRIEKEKKLKAEKEQAKIDYGARLEKVVSTALNLHLFNKKQQMTELFQKMTLETFEHKSASLKIMDCSIGTEKIDSLLVAITCESPGLTDEEEMELNTKFWSVFDDTNFKKQYLDDISECKRLLIDRLPSKKQELEEIKRLEDEKAENLRLQAEADAEERIRLKKLADEAQIEQIRLDGERKLREKEENDKLIKQQEDQQRLANEQIQLRAEGQKAQQLFKNIPEVAPAKSTKVKEQIQIKILHAAAWVQIFQFWFERVGKDLPIEEAGNISLNQMKTFAEKLVNKDNTRIVGTDLLSYVEVTKAVNNKNA